MAWAAAIGAGASVLGSALSSRDARRATSASVANAQADRELQKEMAQMGIRWRVNDAKAAGLHPLAALGMSPASSSSTSVFPQVGDYSGLSDAGQHIGRAINATSTANERHTLDMALLAKERGELENELLRSRISQLNASQNPPLPSAVPTVAGSDGYNVNPVDIPAVQSDRPSQMAGAQPGIRWERTRSGLVSQPNKELIEDADMTNIAALEWYFRNRFLPSTRLPQTRDAPPEAWLPKNALGWQFHPDAQEWRPFYSEGVLSDNIRRIERRSGYKRRFSAPNREPFAAPGPGGSRGRWYRR